MSLRNVNGAAGRHFRLLAAAGFATCLLCGPALASPFPVRAVVEEVEVVAEDVKLIHLRIESPDGFSFDAGQHVHLRLPDASVEEWNREYGTDHREVVRAYSLASSPRELPDARLLVRQVEAPPGSGHPPGIASTYLHERAKPGTTLRLAGPSGEMVRGADGPGDLLLIAGGVGIAPMLGVLEDALAEGLSPDRRVKLFFGARDRQGLYFHDDFVRKSRVSQEFEYFPALSAPAEGDGWEGFVGYIHLLVEREVEDASQATALIAGPEPMVTAAAEVLLKKGIAPANLRTDNRRAGAGLIEELESAVENGGRRPR